jgi:uncharacterized protein (DUF983 family)
MPPSKEAMRCPDALSSAPAAQPVWRAVRNGLRHRCPVCGRGRLFFSYLKTVADCGEDLSQQRADDGPAISDANNYHL